MARGVRTARPGIGLRRSAARRAGAAGSAWRIEAEIAHVESEARKDLNRIADRIVRGEEDDFLRQWGGFRRSGGLRDTDELNGEDLWMVAHIYFDAGNFVSGYPLLERAAKHQERHLELLKNAVEHPRRQASKAMLSRLALTGPGSVELRQRAVVAATSSLMEMQRQLTMARKNLTNPGLGPFHLQRPLLRHMEDILPEQIAMQIDAGRDNAQLLAFIRAYAKRTAQNEAEWLNDLQEADIDHVRRLWRLPERFGAKRPVTSMFLEEWKPYGIREDVSPRLAAEVADAGEWRRVTSPGIKLKPERSTRPVVVAEADTVGDVRLRWRGLMGEAAYHSAGRAHSRSNVRLVVAAKESAVRDLIAEGGEAILLRADGRAASSRSLYRESYPDGAAHGSAHNAALWLGVRLRAHHGSAQVECCAAFPLNAMSTARVPHRILDDVRKMASWPEWLSDGASPEVVAWSSAAVVADPDTGAAHEWVGAPPLSEVLGPGACEHRAATWAPGRLFEEPGSPGHRTASADTTQLSCPSCLRRNIVTVPAHRLPEGHELLDGAREDPERYLDLQYAAEILAGPFAERASSIDELRARDGIVSVDATDYATLDPARAPRRGRRRVRTIGEAMRRQ